MLTTADIEGAKFAFPRAAEEISDSQAAEMPRTTAERAAATFVDHNRGMYGMPPGGVVTHQFASLYYARLCELRPVVEKAACDRWGKEVLTRRVKTLDAEPGAPVLVVGTVYVEMKNKPDIMDEVTRDALETMLNEDDGKPVEKYCGEGDSFVIEDESGRLAIKIPDELAGEMLITGAVVGAAGTVSEGGELHVEGLVVPGLPPQPPIAQPPGVKAGDEPRYIALVSGLRVGSDAHDMVPLDMLQQHLTAQIGCDVDHRMQANIVRLIIAGNATGAGNGADAAGTGSNLLPAADKKLAQPDQKALSEHVRTLDQTLTAISASIPVDLMPGADDPCNYLLPQQPFHPCMLPQASQLATLNLCTNPYCCDIDGVRVLGTAGQPLDDMQRCLPGDDRLKTLQRSLEFQHLAPTAPDTLGCYPFANKEEDPFVVRQCPHIFFAGNQPRYESKLVEGADGQRVCSIMVPDFAKEHTCVLVNLDTLECKPMTFAGLPAVDAMQQE